MCFVCKSCDSWTLIMVCLMHDCSHTFPKAFATAPSSVGKMSCSFTCDHYRLNLRLGCVINQMVSGRDQCRVFISPTPWAEGLHQATQTLRTLVSSNLIFKPVVSQTTEIMQFSAAWGWAAQGQGWGNCAWHGKEEVGSLWDSKSLEIKL